MTHLSILVVDDNAGHRALARAVFEEEGHHVALATDGEEAVAMATADQPDCILMDIRMPNVDGVVACERIRASPGGDAIAIVFVTGQRDVDVFDRALAAGADDFMTKPFRPGELMARVRTALRLRRIASERNELVELLKSQRDQLQRLEIQKEQAVAFLVHDLKNPVHSIDLHAQIVLGVAEDVERSRGAAAKIRDETRALSRMITNLLDISKADAGRLAPVLCAIDAVALVREVLEGLHVRACEAGVEIDAAIAATALHADPDLISRVLTNLVDNAIRHAPEGSQIHVAVAPSADGVELRVADAGPGVPHEMRKAVFERFHSGTEMAARTNRGLGLAFCKLAVEAHGGRIWIEDGFPGAVFCVTLADVDRRN
jgi:two-component system sensor histidine kinase/response regulator